MPNDQAHDTRTTVAEDRVAAAVSLSVDAVASEDFFYDNFEDGLSAGNDFCEWGDSTGTGVSDSISLSGTKSLAFRYKGSPFGQNNDAHAERRFLLKKDVQEIWVQHDLYVPNNHAWRDTDGGGNWSGGGWKQFLLWGGPYNTPSNDNVKIVFEGNFERKNADGPVELDGRVFFIGKIISTAPGASTRHTVTIPYDGPTSVPLLIDPDVDKGHWQRRTYQVVTPSAKGALDGVCRLWIQRRVDTLTPGSVEQIINITDGDWFGPDWNYISGGYLLGYHNQGYDEDTTYYVDNFKVGTTAASIGRGDLL